MAADQTRRNAAERVGVDEEWVLRKLRTNAVMAMRAGDRAAAARPIELIGKHLGMFIERRQVEIAHVDDADEYLAKITALVGKVIDSELPVIDIEPAEPDDTIGRTQVRHILARRVSLAGAADEQVTESMVAAPTAGWAPAQQAHPIATAGAGQVRPTPGKDFRPTYFSPPPML